MALPPYVGYENLIPSATVTARYASSVYPASNLNIEAVTKVLRTADMCVILNGTDEYAYVADHADFDPGGDMTFEFLLNPSAVTGARVIIQHLGASNGYAVRMDGDELVVYLDGASNYVTTTINFFTVDTWVRGKVAYDASAAEVSIYKNGVEVARANNSTQTGCTVNGTLPTSLTNNTGSLYAFSDAAVASVFAGQASYLCITSDEQDHGGYVDPDGANTVAYWPMDGLNGSSKIADISGNAHDLTVSGITDPANFTTCTAYHWVNFNFTSTQDPALLVIDRRHNLTDSTTVKLFRQSPFEAYDLVTSGTITEATTFILEFDDDPDVDWWLEFHDPDNVDGYLEIPMVYLGSKSALNLSFAIDFEDFDITPVTIVNNSINGDRRYQRGGKHYQFEYPWNLVTSNDTTIWRAVRDAAVIHPFVFSVDSTAANTFFVNWLDVEKWGRKGIIQSTGVKKANMTFRELPGGVDQ